MAKPLGEKARIIREGLRNHPEMGNVELAALLMNSLHRQDDRLEITAADVGRQRRMMAEGRRGVLP